MIHVYRVLRWFDRHCVTILVLCVFSMVISLAYQVYTYKDHQSKLIPVSCPPPAPHFHPDPIQEQKVIERLT